MNPPISDQEMEDLSFVIHFTGHDRAVGAGLMSALESDVRTRTGLPHKETTHSLQSVIASEAKQ